jgi:hypothetical protein
MSARHNGIHSSRRHAAELTTKYFKPNRFSCLTEVIAAHDDVPYLPQKLYDLRHFFET